MTRQLFVTGTCLRTCQTLVMAAVSISLSVSAAGQQASEIYLFDINHADDGLALVNPRNVSQHPGYDNQPHFHPGKPWLFYSSFNDQGRSDIRIYDLQSKSTRMLTETQEREYSPTVTPDGRFVSCIIQRDDGAQDLGKYPVDGGQPTVLVENLVIGYHAWIDDQRLLLFVLGQPMTLQLYDLKTQSSKTIAKNIGRSLLPIPGKGGISFVQKSDNERWKLMRYDPATEKIEEWGELLPGREDLAWTPAGKIVMSDGSRIFLGEPSRGKIDWRPVPAEGVSLSGITRLAVSADGKQLAVVADE